MEEEIINPIHLFGLVFGSMIVVGIIGFTWAIWHDYKTGHTKHKEKFFGDD